MATLPKAPIILCVDDELARLRFRQLVLEAKGYKVLLATSAQQGIEALQSNPVDLVIADHLMGRALGVEMAVTIKRLKPHVPIIILSASSGSPEGTENADAYVCKSEGPDALLNRVSALLAPAGFRRERDEVQAGEAQTRLAAIVESCHDVVWSATLDGMVATWNRAGERIFGYKAEEVIGKHVSMLGPPERKHEFDDIFNAARRGESAELETVRVRKDGSRFPALVTAFPIRDQEGTIVGRAAIVRDLTEQRRSQEAPRAADERLRLAAEVTRLGIWELNPATYEVVANQEVRRIFGLADHAPILRKDLVAKVHPEDRRTIEEAIRRALTGERGGQFQAEYRVTAAGRVRWVSSQGRVHFDEAGKPVRFIGTMVDTTEQKRIDEMQRQAERLKSIGGMAGTLAHEINNPLAALTNALHLMRDQPQSERAHEYFNIAELELARVSHITRQALAFNPTEEPERVSLACILDEAVGLFAEEIRSRNISVEHKYKGFGQGIAHPGEMR